MFFGITISLVLLAIVSAIFLIISEKQNNFGVSKKASEFEIEEIVD
jgi:uncharacterized membrane protein